MRRAALVALLAAVGCGEAAEGGPRLSELGLFADLPGQVPAAGVVPYDVNVTLYADEAAKWRFVQLPPGGTITWEADGTLTFPVGTRLIKTFGYFHDYRAPAAGHRLIETRILERTADTWAADVYLWNDAQTDAVRHVAGRKVEVAWIDAAGVSKTLPYRVPDTNQCANCHASEKVNRPLGPVARQLNKDHDYGGGVVANQLEHWAALGLFAAPLPPLAERPAMPDPFGDAPLEARARAYLDANCAHCHQPGGAAGATGLDLRWGTDLTSGTGVCKAPVAAGPGTGGRDYVIVPGQPDDSIMVYRIESTEPGEKMPELPTQTTDPPGIALVREWIATMDPMTCVAP